MKTIVPDYFSRFSCRMGACLHSCCIGWEIDIDPDQLEYYQSLTGDIGKKLQENICKAEDGACFHLTEDERCPFLNVQGLCELILELGEDSLCQICADHPRFRNFFADREEIGLGLCCEAAGALILKNTARTKFIAIEDDKMDDPPDEFEDELTELRQALMDIIQDRNLHIDQRICRMLEYCRLPRPAISEDWIRFFLSLERLDPRWGKLLEGLEADLPSPSCSSDLELALEQLLVYLLYRHLPGALEDEDVAGRILFAVLCAELLLCICAQRAAVTLDDFVELARMFSSEIEYSDENIGAILEHLHELYPGI